MQQGRCCPRSQGRRDERDGLERQARGRTQGFLRFLLRRAGENGRFETGGDDGRFRRKASYAGLDQPGRSRDLGRPLRRSSNVSEHERYVAADSREESQMVWILLSTL